MPRPDSSNAILKTELPRIMPSATDRSPGSALTRSAADDRNRTRAEQVDGAGARLGTNGSARADRLDYCFAALQNSGPSASGRPNLIPSEVCPVLEALIVWLI